MNDFIQVKFDSENLKVNKKFSQNCKQYKEEGLKLFQTGCNIKIEVKNVSKQKLFLWVFKLKQNYKYARSASKFIIFECIENVFLCANNYGFNCKCCRIFLY